MAENRFSGEWEPRRASAHYVFPNQGLGESGGVSFKLKGRGGRCAASGWGELSAEASSRIGHGRGRYWCADRVSKKFVKFAKLSLWFHVAEESTGVLRLQTS